MSLPLARQLCALAASQGGLPSLAGLLNRAAAVDAELPELSPVNWTSLLTGVGPEEHGIFGFTRLDPATYTLAINDAAAIQAPTVLAAASARGLTIRSLNVPTTSPAAALGPLRGMLVGGFVANSLREAVHPPLLAPMLERAGYRLEADTVAGKQDHHRLLAELNTALDGRRAGFDLLWQGQDFDVFLAVLTETDRLFHFALHAVLDPAHPLHGDCLRLLRKLDHVLGRWLQAYQDLPEPKRLLVCADHGFAPLVSEVDVNSWLARHGWLALESRPRTAELDATAISARSRAFALDPGRVYVHDRARFARGSVEPAEADRLIPDLRAGLASLRHQGEPVFRKVHLGKELYPGAAERFGSLVPDLVCEPHPGYSATAKFDVRQILGLHGRSGAHCVRGAIFADSRDCPDTPPARLRDVGARIFHHFGLRPGP